MNLFAMKKIHWKYERFGIDQFVEVCFFAPSYSFYGATYYGKFTEMPNFDLIECFI